MSVVVAPQWCGALGMQSNCQVAVSLHAASDTASVPISWRLFLPAEWQDDTVRRAKAGVPEDVGGAPGEVASNPGPDRRGDRHGGAAPATGAAVGADLHRPGLGARTGPAPDGRSCATRRASRTGTWGGMGDFTERQVRILP